MTFPTKRRRITNLRLREISTVDRPAQVGAVAVLIKRAGEEDVTYDTILKSAGAVCRGEQPTHSRDEYETALLKRADVLAKEQSISPEQALSRNLTTDAELRDLPMRASERSAAARRAPRPQGPSCTTPSSGRSACWAMARPCNSAATSVTSTGSPARRRPEPAYGAARTSTAPGRAIGCAVTAG